jgi:diketogulonate reductase-like aldo/keto reductase
VCSSLASDTAELYKTEEEVGQAIAESGLARNEIFITTKYGGLNGLDIETSIKESLKKVRAEILNLTCCWLTVGRH